MQFRKSVTSLIAAGLLAIGGVAGVLAQDGNSSGELPVDVEVGSPDDADVRWTIVESVPWPTIQSDLDEDQVETGTITVTVTDNRFNQRGWTLSISANDFVGVGTGRTIPISNFSLEAGTVNVLAGDADPLPVGHSFSLSPDSHVLFEAEPGSGSGRYSVPFTSEVMIPANTLADMYRTTITISLDSAP